MPGGDRTGPLGMGPMTGRAAGYCAGYGVPGYINPIPGRGFFGRGRGWFGRGMGRGFGRGRGMGYFAGGFPGYGYYGTPVPTYAPELSPEEEITLLKEDAEVLKQQLKELQGYIDTLEKAKSQEKK
ncbi:MAG: DUF5320 domain-containing protein [candidate division WOR-3 bacterium]|jgi:hypothetical protein